MDPFSLIAAGVGTVGSLAGGIYNAATAPARKRKWKEQQKKEALYSLYRNRAAAAGAPTASLDAMHANHQIDEQADQQFQFDPMSLVPFVSNGANLANKIYQGANEQPAAGPISDRENESAGLPQGSTALADVDDALGEYDRWKPYGRTY